MRSDSDQSRKIGPITNQAQPIMAAIMPIITKPKTPQNGSAIKAGINDNLKTVRSGCMAQGYSARG